MQFSSIFSAVLAASVVAAQSMSHHSSDSTIFAEAPSTYAASAKPIPTSMPNGTNITTGSPIVVSGNGAPSLLSQNGGWITVAGLGALFAVFM